MKRTKNILIFTFLILLTLGCRDKNAEKEIRIWNKISGNLNVESLINFLIEFPNTDKKNIAYEKLDSLIKLNQQLSLANIAIEPYPDSEINPIFINPNDDYGDYYIRERNAYLLTLDKNGLTHNNQPIEISQFSTDLKAKFFQFETTEESTQREVKEIEFFGFVLVSKVIIVLDIQEDIKEINWENYIKAIRQVFAVYKDIWNLKSIEIWDIEFEKLETKKKEALTRMYPFGMELNFCKRTFRNK